MCFSSSPALHHKGSRFDLAKEIKSIVFLRRFPGFALRTSDSLKVVTWDKGLGFFII
jgi:hypothetical protein